MTKGKDEYAKALKGARHFKDETFQFCMGTCSLPARLP